MLPAVSVRCSAKSISVVQECSTKVVLRLHGTMVSNGFRDNCSTRYGSTSIGNNATRCVQRHYQINPTQLQQRSFMSTQPMLAAEEEPHMMLILGKPGGGKGTISNKILKDFPKIQHISSGDILRAHVRGNTSLGQKAKGYMDVGRLVPDDLMIELVMDEATPVLEEGKCLLLDGFPRTLEQAKALDQVAFIDTVINLDIPTEVIVERIADRWIHPASGRIYSYSYKPPKVKGLDDMTGDPLIQRDDDKPESVRTRLNAYDDVTSPLVNYYERRGVLMTFSGTMSDIIYPKVKEWLQNTKQL